MQNLIDSIRRLVETPLTTRLDAVHIALIAIVVYSALIGWHLILRDVHTAME